MLPPRKRAHVRWATHAFTHLNNVSFLPLVSSPRADSSDFKVEMVAFLLGLEGTGGDGAASSGAVSGGTTGLYVS
jgi:hypothetical protein